MVNNKSYGTAEETIRYETWYSNHLFVQEHNARFMAGLESFTVEMNKFADLTEVCKTIFFKKNFKKCGEFL